MNRIVRIMLVAATFATQAQLLSAQETTASTTMPDLRSTAPVVLATWNNGSFTNIDLSSTLHFRKPASMQSVDENSIYTLPVENVREVVSDLVYEQLLYKKAIADGITSDLPDLKARLSNFDDLTLAKIYYDAVFMPRINKLQEADLREIYEADKATRYTIPEILKVQEIWFSNYKPHTVAEGETLESIAKKINGNAEASKGILRDDVLHYYRQAPTAGSVKSRTFPLKPGEELLVPVSKDEETSQKIKADETLKKVRSGDDFLALAGKFSDAPKERREESFMPDIAGVEPPMADFLKAGKKGDVSEVIVGTHGRHILKIADKLSTTVLPFDEVKGKILIPTDNQEKHAAKIRIEVMKELSEKYKLEINSDLLKRKFKPGDESLTTGSVIASAPGFKYTLAEFMHDIEPTMKSYDELSFDERLEWVQNAPAVVRFLIQKDAEARNLDQSTEYRDAVASKELMEIVGEYMRRQQAQLTPVSEAELRDFYQKNIDRYTQPGKVTLREITKRVNQSQTPAARAQATEKAKEELIALRKNIKTADDFEQVARRESQSIATRSRGGLIGEVAPDFRGPSVRNVIEQLKPGEISAPFLYGTEVQMLKMDARTPSVAKPYEEVAKQVRNDYNKSIPGQTEAAKREAMLKEAGFTLKF